MKRYIIAAGMVTFLIFCLTMGDALAGRKLLDDFSGTYMDPEKWQDCEFVRKVAGGKLVSKLGSSDGDGHWRNQTSFQNAGGIYKIACTITVVEGKPQPTNPVAFARIGGTFYNVQGSGGGTGDIWAEVQIRVDANGSDLYAFYEVERFLDDNFNNSVVIGSGTFIPPGTLQTGTPYQVELEYTNAHDIIFRVAGQSATFPDAGRQRGPVLLTKQLATGLDTDSGPGTGYVSALFDDVFINDQAQAYDRFSSSLIDTAKWIQQESVREISNGKLRLNVRANGQRESATSRPVDQSTTYLEAKTLVESGSQLSAGTNGFARLAGWYYNESGPPYDGNKNDVWVVNKIDLDDNNNLNANCYLWRADDPDPWGPGTSLFYQQFNTPIAFDTKYTLSIELRGSTFIFKCNNETYQYDVTTSMYTPSEGQYRQLQSRVYADPGESGYIKTIFDDVYIFAPGISPGVNILLLGEP